MVRVKHPQPHSTRPDQCKQQHIMDSTPAVPDGSGRHHQTKTPSSSFNKIERRLFFTTTFSTLRDMWAFTRPIYPDNCVYVPHTATPDRPTLRRIASYFCPPSTERGEFPVAPQQCLGLHSSSSLVDIDPQHHQPGLFQAG